MNGLFKLITDTVGVAYLHTIFCNRRSHRDDFSFLKTKLAYCRITFKTKGRSLARYIKDGYRTNPRARDPCDHIRCARPTCAYSASKPSSYACIRICRHCPRLFVVRTDRLGTLAVVKRM